jgi:hypothetical protein
MDLGSLLIITTNKLLQAKSKVKRGASALKTAGGFTFAEKRQFRQFSNFPLPGKERFPRRFSWQLAAS